MKLTDLIVRILEKTVIENQIAQLQKQILMLKSLIDARNEELLLRDIESDANSESEGD